MQTTTPLSLSFSSAAIAALILGGCVQQQESIISGDAAQSSAHAEVAMAGPEHILFAEADVVWNDAPPSLPAGAKIAVLEGDPSKPGPFTLRLRFPANYRVAPHFHPADEHVTVLSGSFALGMGNVFDESTLEEIGTGGFAMMRTGTRHFALSKDGAVVQLNGVGPWGLTYVNPTDDPRNATK